MAPVAAAPSAAKNGANTNFKDKEKSGSVRSSNIVAAKVLNF